MALISLQMRAEAIRLCGARVPRREVAAHLGISTGSVDQIVWRAQSEGLLPSGIHANWRLTVADAPAPKVVDPLWSKARKLAAARRIKRRFCVDHIADDLCQLPGPPVLPRDVVRFMRGIAA